jgi:hypothetical protein
MERPFRDPGRVFPIALAETEAADAVPFDFDQSSPYDN